MLTYVLILNTRWQFNTAWEIHHVNYNNSNIDNILISLHHYLHIYTKISWNQSFGRMLHSTLQWKESAEVELLVRNPQEWPGRPDYFNHSSPLTDSQILLCSQGSRRALTNHLASPSLHSDVSFSLLWCYTMKEDSREKNMRLIYLLQCSLGWSPLPHFLSCFSLSFSGNWNQLVGRALVVGNVGQARSNKKVLTFLWLYAAWKGCRGLVRHERSSINFTYFSQAPVRRP